jgi:hypothetical protein
MSNKSMNQSASNSNIESTSARKNPLTNGPNNELNNNIQLQNIYENQITKEIGISIALVKPFF